MKFIQKYFWSKNWNYFHYDTTLIRSQFKLDMRLDLTSAPNFKADFGKRVCLIMLHLLHLPRDILVRIFLHHFTLQEVIPIRCSCRELYCLVHYCLGRRRTLKLFFSFADVKSYSQVLYEHNLESDTLLCLHPPGPSSDELILDKHQFLNPVVDLLVDGLFPNVSHLIIYFGFNNLGHKSRDDRARLTLLIQDNLTYLLQRMRTRLTGLSLVGTNRGDYYGESNSRLLLRQINQMHNLTQLDLCVKCLFLCSNNNFDAHMDNEEQTFQPEPMQPFLVLEPKILNKLERINILFDIEQNGKNFCKHSFCHLGPNLTRLGMHQLYAGQYYYVPEPLLSHSLIGPRSQLATCSITHLKVTQHLPTLLPKILPRFGGLKSLDLVNFTFSQSERAMSLMEVLGIIAQCSPKLTEIKLSKFTLGWLRDDANLATVPQFELVTRLALKCVHQKYAEIKQEDSDIPFGKFFRTFAHIFPNLERFDLKTEPNYFIFSDGDSTETFEIMKRLRMLSIAYYYGTIETKFPSHAQFTCHHLLGERYRSRYIRECGDRWVEMKTHWVLYYKDFRGVWMKECF